MNAQTNYAFPVELQPVYLGNNIEIPDRKAVVRTDTNQPLGVVSNDYGLVPHSNVIDAFREAGKEYGVEEKISLTRNGANLFYQMTFPKIEMEAKKGDIVRMMLIVKNSYNGMHSLQIVFGAFRLVCLNGMIIGKEFFQFNFRHIGNVGGMVNADIADYKNAYSQYVKLFGEKAPQIAEMTKKPLKATDGLFDKKNIMLPEYLLNEAKQSYEHENDSTVWGYYNSLTYAITHKLRKSTPNLSIKYGVKAWKAAEQIM